MVASPAPVRTRFGGIRLVRAAAAFGIALSTLALGVPTAATAAGADDKGLWYYQDYGVSDAAAAGFTGKGVTVAVIDGLVNSTVPALSGANLEVRADSFCAERDDNTVAVPAESKNFVDSAHGTDMVSFIAGNGDGVDSRTPAGVAPGAKVLYYAISYETSTGTQGCPMVGGGERNVLDGEAFGMASAIDEAIDAGARIISISVSNSFAPPELTAAVARAVHEGVVIVAARPNDTAPTRARDIWGMNGVVTVQAMTPDGTIQASSAVADAAIDVVGPGVDVLALGNDFSRYTLSSGTSNATSITAGYLAVVASKYPDATGSQLIQSLIRNTGTEDHELSRDPKNYAGYGAVSLRHMLAVDPTAYEDANPLVTNDGSPSPEQIADPTAAGPTTDPNGTASGGGSAIPVVPIVIGGVVVAAGVVTAIILARRRSAATTTRGPVA